MVLSGPGLPLSTVTASTARWRCHAKPRQTLALCPRRLASALDISAKRDLAIYLLALIKMRLDSVKRMIQIQNTSWSSAATKYFTVTAREHTLAPPGRHRPRHSRMSLTARQNTPAIDGAFYRPNETLYQLQPSFHTQSTEPEPTARARRAGEEFY